MKQIVISGYYGYDNAGDEAVLMAITSALKSLEEDLKIVVLSSNPEITSKRYAVQAVNRTNFVEIIKEIKKCDLFISGGGSLLQDTTGWKSIPYYAGLLYLAALMGKKTAVYGQGIGPVSGKFNKYLIKKALRKVDLISVRDNLSKKLLADLGLKRNDIITTADPVFLLKDLPRQKDDGVKELEKIIDLDINHKKPLIGISVRPWHDNDYLQKLVPVVEEMLRTTGGQAVIIPLFHHEDLDISREFESKLDGAVTLVDKKLEPLEIMNIFSELDLFIGVRLHSLIFAALYNIPLVGLKYDPKVEGFLANIALNSSVDIEDFNPDTLLRITETVWKNRSRFSKVLENVGKRSYKNAYYNAAAVLKLLE